MTPDTRKVDEKLLTKMRIVAARGFSNSAQGLSKMIGQELSVNSPDVGLVPLADIPDILGGPDNDAVGVYLRFDGELTGQIMMVISYQQALDFVTWYWIHLREPPRNLEGWNVLPFLKSEFDRAFFLNAIYEITGLSSHPSPPAVMVDMVGSILDVVIATMGAIYDQI